jgi:hypothetical protein
MPILPTCTIACIFSLVAFASHASARPASHAPANDAGAQLVQHYYDARRTTGRVVPDTLDLADNAILAIHAITAGQDPKLESRLWFSIYFDRRPMCMRHHQLSEFDQAGKYLEGLALTRLMTGSTFNSQGDANLWAFIDNHTKDDGLIYYDMDNPDEKPVYTYTQARALLARICRYELEPTKERAAEINRTIDSLVERNMLRGFGFGPLLPAVRWYEMTGYENALRLAELDFQAVMEESSFADGTFQGHFHYHSGALIGVLAYAQMKDDQQLIERVCKAYEFARSQGTDYGYFPEALAPYNWVMRISNEGCCTADMTSLAATLSRTGAGDYWDDLDRYLRNQLTEMQMKRTDYPQRVPHENQVRMPIRPEAGEDEVDDMTRFIGTFAGWAAPNDFAGSAHFWIQQCCLGNCPRGLYQGWASIVTHSDEGLRVNLLLNRSTPELDVDSYLPYEGKVNINIKQPTHLEVRMPGWVELDKVTARVDDEPVAPTCNGRYLDLGDLSQGEVVTIEFPVREYQVTYHLPGATWASKYSIVDEQSGSGMPLPRSVEQVPQDIVDRILEPKPYTVLYRGNTVVDILPEGYIYPLYEREFMRHNPAPLAPVDRHVPQRVLEDWQ